MWGEWIEILGAVLRPRMFICLSPCGESGLKSGSRPVSGTVLPKSLPVWGEWIEMGTHGTGGKGTSSLPVWGEWIEIPLFAPFAKAQAESLPVWGEWIEMRHFLKESTAGVRTSLPVWGEWIEIVYYIIEQFFIMSLPVWGEWIEIASRFPDSFPSWGSLPVWGEWIEIVWTEVRQRISPVSPRVGRVD